MKPNTKKFFLFGCPALALVLCGWCIALWRSVEINYVEYGEGSVTLDFQVLGEYPSAFKKLALIEESSESPIVVLVPAKAESVHIWKIELKCGENPAHLGFGNQVRIIEPKARSIVVLHPDREYRLRIWRTEELLGNRTRSEVFRFPKSQHKTTNS